MTVPVDQFYVTFQGDGVSTVFPFTFLIPEADNLSFYLIDSAGNKTVIGSGLYAVTGIGNANGGSITYDPSGIPVPVGTTITIERMVPYSQLLDLVNQDGFYPDAVEGAFDALEMQIQQLKGDVDLAWKMPLGEAGPEFPMASLRAGMTTIFDATTGLVILIPVLDSADNLSALLNGQLAFNFPDEANGGTVPTAGSNLPYLSATFVKVA